MDESIEREPYCPYHWMPLPCLFCDDELGEADDGIPRSYNTIKEDPRWTLK
jgi:hypothetical protein